MGDIRALLQSSDGHRSSTPSLFPSSPDFQQEQAQQAAYYHHQQKYAYQPNLGYGLPEHSGPHSMTFAEDRTSGLDWNNMNSGGHDTASSRYHSAPPPGPVTTTTEEDLSDEDRTSGLDWNNMNSGGHDTASSRYHSAPPLGPVTTATEEDLSDLSGDLSGNGADDSGYGAGDHNEDINIDIPSPSELPSIERMMEEEKRAAEEEERRARRAKKVIGEGGEKSDAEKEWEADEGKPVELLRGKMGSMKDDMKARRVPKPNDPDQSASPLRWIKHGDAKKFVLESKTQRTFRKGLEAKAASAAAEARKEVARKERAEIDARKAELDKVIEEGPVLNKKTNKRGPAKKDGPAAAAANVANGKGAGKGTEGDTVRKDWTKEDTLHLISFLHEDFDTFYNNRAHWFKKAATALANDFSTPRTEAAIKGRWELLFKVYKVIVCLDEHTGGGDGDEQENSEDDEEDETDSDADEQGQKKKKRKRKGGFTDEQLDAFRDDYYSYFDDVCGEKSNIVREEVFASGQPIKKRPSAALEEENANEKAVAEEKKASRQSKRAKDEADREEVRAGLSQMGTAFAGIAESESKKIEVQAASHAADLKYRQARTRQEQEWRVEESRRQSLRDERDFQIRSEEVKISLAGAKAATLRERISLARECKMDPDPDISAKGAATLLKLLDELASM